MRKRHPPELIFAVISAYNGGLSFEGVARNLGIPTTTVQYMMRKHAPGAIRQRPRPRPKRRPHAERPSPGTRPGSAPAAVALHPDERAVFISIARRGPMVGLQRLMMDVGVDETCLNRALEGLSEKRLLQIERDTWKRMITYALLAWPADLPRLDTRLLPRERPCLRCGQDFRSEGVHNRLCTWCKRHNASAVEEIA